MKRVRYSKVDSDTGVKKSVSKIVGENDKELQVQVNVNDNTFKVVSLPEGFVELEGNAKSYQLVLRKVKLALDELGVDLTSESRNRDLPFIGMGAYSFDEAPVSAKGNTVVE